MRRLLGAVLVALLIVPASAQGGPLRESARKQGVRLAAQTAQTPAPPAQRKERPWPARHPVLLGTLVGTGVGLGFLASQGCGSSDYTCTGLMLFMGGTGAGIGALGGLAVSLVIR